MEKLLLSPVEAAEQLGLSRTKVFDLIRLGQLRSVKIGGCRRIPRVALAEFLASFEEVA